jgi:AraC-like DNA-binding protein/quercetin dioxygenase-like cupin family protein
VVEIILLRVVVVEVGHDGTMTVPAADVSAPPANALSAPAELSAPADASGRWPAHTGHRGTASGGSVAGARLVEVRDGGVARAVTFLYEANERVSAWHHHDLHQIEYAIEGVAEVETAAGHHVLPPQQAIWIPAGLRHRTTLVHMRSLAVFFDPAMVTDHDDRARVIAVTPLLREMLVHAARWPIWRSGPDPVSEAFFDALALLVVEWLDDELPLCLPTSDDPVVADVMTYTQEHLATVTSAEVCAAVGLSERSLRRRFTQVGMTWREYLGASRMLRAMAMLGDPRRSVAAIAGDVGFESTSSFTRAFRAFAGESPTEYRARAVPDDRPRGPGSPM